MNEQEFVLYNERLFRRVAPNYRWLDLLASGCRTKFCRFLGNTAGLNILDLATGTGKQAIALARRGGHVTGADLSEDMLHYARINARRLPVSFVHANGTSLPFEDGTFDITVMSFALHCMTPEVRLHTLQEMKRVTRAGGQVAFIDHCKPTGTIGRFIYRNYARFETPLYKAFLESDFTTQLQSAGLYTIRHERFFFGAMQMLACKAVYAGDLP